MLPSARLFRSLIPIAALAAVLVPQRPAAAYSAYVWPTGGLAPGAVSANTLYQLEFTAFSDWPGQYFSSHQLHSEINGGGWGLAKGTLYSNPVTWNVMQSATSIVSWKDTATWTVWMSSPVSLSTVVEYYISP